jgi:hypothetical protein
MQPQRNQPPQRHSALFQLSFKRGKVFHNDEYIVFKRVFGFFDTVMAVRDDVAVVPLV